MAKFGEDKKDGYDRIREQLEDLPPELKIVDDNLEFEKKLEENPIPPGINQVKVFNYETWDLNAILKGNYWRRSIYTTDKICKLFLKASIETQKKYFKKKNPMEFNFFWLLILIGIGLGGFLFILVFILPRIGGMV